MWIGMSVLSFFEVFELIMMLLHYCLCGGTRSNKTESMVDLDGSVREITKTPIKSFVVPD